MNIGELFVRLGFKADTEKLNNFDKSIKSVSLGALKASVAITAVAYAITKVMQASMATAVGLDNFAIQTGLSAQALQKWKYMADQSNVSGQELESSIRGIQKAQADIRMGAGNIRPFQLLGISAHENPLKVIEQLKNRIHGLEPALASSIMSQLGVGQNMINMLKKSNFEFDKMNEKFLLTQNETDKLLEMNRVFKDFIFTLKGIRDRLVALVSPVLIEFLKGLKNLFSNLFDASKFILDIIDRFKWLGKAIAIVGIILLIVFKPWVVLILGIILLIEDLWVAFKGGESVIGKFIASFFGFKNLKELIDGVKDSFKVMVDYITTMWEKLKDLFSNKLIARLFGSSEIESMESGKVPPNAGTGTNAQTNNNININVSGISEADSQQVAFNIKREIEKIYFTKPVSI